MKGTLPFIANTLKGPLFSFAKIINDSVQGGITDTQKEFDTAIATAGKCSYYRSYILPVISHPGVSVRPKPTK